MQPGRSTRAYARGTQQACTCRGHRPYRQSPASIAWWTAHSTAAPTSCPARAGRSIGGLRPACGVAAWTRPSQSVPCPQQLEEERPVSLVLGCASVSFRTLHDHLSPGLAHAPMPSLATPIHNHFENEKLILHRHRSAAAPLPHSLCLSIHFKVQGRRLSLGNLTGVCGRRIGLLFPPRAP